MAITFGIQAISDLIRSVEKAFGRGTLMAADGDAVEQGIDVIPTGSFALDRALGIGGVPKGRIIEIYGPEASGKTTMALAVVAQAQRQGGLAAFVDAEHALDLRYARMLGVDCSRMLLSQPDCGEQAMDVVEALVQGAGVTRAAVLPFDDSSVMRFRAAHGLSPEYQARVDGHSPWSADTVNPPALLINDGASDPAVASLRDIVAAERIGALACLPLSGGGRLRGNCRPACRCC